jgi:hypothetical protein
VRRFFRERSQSGMHGARRLRRQPGHPLQVRFGQYLELLQPRAEHRLLSQHPDARSGESHRMPDFELGVPVLLGQQLATYIPRNRRKPMRASSNGTSSAK